MRLLLAALLLVPALAHADDKTPDVRKMASDDCARARAQKKKCVLDMGGETVEVGVVKPDGIGKGILIFGTHDSLIRVRKDFIVEILKTAEDL